MNVKRVKKELDSMPAIIKMDVKAWQLCIENGGEQMQHYAELCAKIFYNQQLLNDAMTKREESAIEQRLGRLLKRLDKSNNAMKQLLNTLQIIKDRTERMWRRICLWMDDSDLRQHCICWELTVPKLQKFLKFLHMRYDCEWEVKEMVVLELEQVGSNYEVQILVEAWCGNRHVGGDQFQYKLNKFLRLMGQRQCAASINTL